MAVKADYWDCTATLNACLTQLRAALASPTLTAAVFSHLITVLPEQVDVKHVWPVLAAAFAAAHPACAQLLPMLGAEWNQWASTAMLRLFGQVRQVITTDNLREQFCSLPFHLVLQWAGLDQLVVDSENNVAVLLTAAVQQRHPTH